mmetsp:Transcript_50767/g.110186  ORF Transcript_50767/g.110186 Transcript_50767/m.110186 type:complete len:268 (-) Transcript_50767:826-1629(-)
MQARSSVGRRILAETQGSAVRPSSDGERTVRVRKPNRDARIGMRLGLHPVSGQVVISDLYQGYPAVETGRLFVGDAVKSINGVRIDSVDLAMQIIRLAEGNVEFVMTNVYTEAVSAIARGDSAKILGSVAARAPPPPPPPQPAQCRSFPEVTASLTSEGTHKETSEDRPTSFRESATAPYRARASALVRSPSPLAPPLGRAHTRERLNVWRVAELAVAGTLPRKPSAQMVGADTGGTDARGSALSWLRLVEKPRFSDRGSSTSVGSR